MVIPGRFEQMGLSISKAAKEWGISRTTIHTKINNGMLSLCSDRTVDPAEMLRVFGEPKKLNSVQLQPEKTAMDSIVQGLEQQLKHEKELRLQTEQRAVRAESQVDMLMNQVGHLTETIKLLEPPAPVTRNPEKAWVWLLLVCGGVFVAGLLFFLRRIS